MAKTNLEYAKLLVEKGYCDNRHIAFCATADMLPNGSYGMCVMTVKGHDLLISDMEGMKAIPTKLLYKIPLREVRDLQIVPNMFVEIFKGYSFKFTYRDFQFVFKNCAQQKACLSVIQEEAQNA